MRLSLCGYVSICTDASTDSKSLSRPEILINTGLFCHSVVASTFLCVKCRRDVMSSVCCSGLLQRPVPVNPVNMSIVQ